MPALATTMSRRPWRSSACLTRSSACAGSRTSTPSDEPPISAASEASASSSKPATTTVAPHAASARAVAAPIPWLAPVTTATVPVSSTGSVCQALRLRQLQRRDLVGVEHREPRVTVRRDGNAYGLAALDHLRLQVDDTCRRDPGDRPGAAL